MLTSRQVTDRLLDNAQTITKESLVVVSFYSSSQVRAKRGALSSGRTFQVLHAYSDSSFAVRFHRII